jgi:hypothetical protein
MKGMNFTSQRSVWSQLSKCRTYHTQDPERNLLIHSPRVRTNGHEVRTMNDLEDLCVGRPRGRQVASIHEWR